MALHCNGSKLPFHVNFVYSQDNKVEINQIWNFGYIPNNSEFITINEYWKIGLQFFVEEEEEFDKEAYIEIQTSLFDEEDNQTAMIYQLSKSCNEIYWIFGENSQDMYPWRMGSYLINIYYNGERYTTGIKIAPTHLNSEQIEQIHSFLQETVEGIIYDYVLSNKSYSQITPEELKTKWFYEYARFITDFQDLLVYLFSRVEKNPHTTIVNQYQESKNIGKMGIKSVKWNLSKSYKDGSRYYNKAKIFDYSSVGNKWIKNILYNWKNDINNALTQIKNKYLKLQGEISILEQKRNELQQEKNRLSNKWNIAKTEIINLDTRIMIKEKDLKESLTILKQHEKWIDSLESIKNRIVHLLFNSFFSEIQMGQKKPLLKHNVYFLLDELYHESKKIKKNEGNKKRLVKIYKPTWLIFEYYCLFSTLDLLKELGFKLTEAFHPQMLELYYENKIPSGYRFILENHNAIIHVWYDKYHAHSNKEAKEKGELFFTNVMKKRPDIKVDVYIKEDNGGLLFKDSIVIDAKFRKLQSIYNKDYVKNTFDQLTSYNQFFYIGKNRLYNSRGPIVNRVICLYAGDEGSKVKQVEHPITFIKFFPVIKEDVVMEVGREELKEELIEWLDGVI